MEGFRAAVGSHFLTGWWSCIFMVWALCSLCVMPESLKFIKKASLREVNQKHRAFSWPSVGHLTVRTLKSLLYINR